MAALSARPRPQQSEDSADERRRGQPGQGRASHTSRAGAPILAGAVHRCCASCKPRHAAAAELPRDGGDQRERLVRHRRPRPLLLQAVFQEAPRGRLGNANCDAVSSGIGRPASKWINRCRGQSNLASAGDCWVVPAATGQESARARACRQCPPSRLGPSSHCPMGPRLTLRWAQLEGGPQLTHHLAALRHQLPQHSHQGAAPSLPTQRRLGLPAAGRGRGPAQLAGRRRANQQQTGSSQEGRPWCR